MIHSEIVAFASYLPVTPAWPVTSETGPLPLDYSTLHYIFHQCNVQWWQFSQCQMIGILFQVIVYFTHQSPLGVAKSVVLWLSSHHFPQSPVTNRCDCDEMSDVTPRDGVTMLGRVTCHVSRGWRTWDRVSVIITAKCRAAIIRDIRRHVYEMMEWNTKINLLSPQIRLLLCVMCGLPSVPSALLLPSLCDDTKCDS